LGAAEELTGAEELAGAEELNGGSGYTMGEVLAAAEELGTALLDATVELAGKLALELTGTEDDLAGALEVAGTEELAGAVELLCRSTGLVTAGYLMRMFGVSKSDGPKTLTRWLDMLKTTESS